MAPAAAAVMDAESAAWRAEMAALRCSRSLAGMPLGVSWAVVRSSQSSVTNSCAFFSRKPVKFTCSSRGLGLVSLSSVLFTKPITTSSSKPSIPVRRSATHLPITPLCTLRVSTWGERGEQSVRAVANSAPGAIP